MARQQVGFMEDACDFGNCMRLILSRAEVEFSRQAIRSRTICNMLRNLNIAAEHTPVRVRDKEEPDVVLGHPFDLVADSLLIKAIHSVICRRPPETESAVVRAAS